MATYQGVRVLRQTNGRAVVVGEDTEIMRSQLMLAADEGLYLEASSVTAVQAAERLAAEDLIAEDEVIVAIGTSTGLKDIETTAARLDEVPLIEPTLPALQAQIQDS